MPNQRKQGKKKVGAWVDEPTATEIERYAKSLGIPVSDFVKHALREYVNKERTHD